LTDHSDDEQTPLTGLNSRGASIVIKDPRMSKLLAWFYGSLGMACVTGSWIAANNLYQINLTLAADAIVKQEMARQLAEQRALNERQDEHINAVDRRVYTLEGRNLRGGPTRGR
jgi:hypothetical protein